MPRPLAPSTRVKRVLCVLLLLSPLARAADSVNIDSLPKYQGIVDPALAEGELALLAFSMATQTGAAGAAGYLMAETMRLNAITALSVIESGADDATAAALTTNTLKDVRIALECESQNARILIAKIKADLKWYEDKYPNFSNPAYTPTNRIEKQDWEKYKTIRDALKSFKYTRVNEATKAKEDIVLDNAEQTLTEKTKAVADALLEVQKRLDKGKYGLPSLKLDSGFMAVSTEPFNSVVFSIAVMAEQLSAQAPKTQLRLVLDNTSKDLAFLVQLEARDRDGTYAIRPDTKYPLAIYPDVSSATPEELRTLQVPPYTNKGQSHGRVSLTLPVNPRDKLIIRAVTMGQIRDRVRFMPVRGKSIRPDLNSLSRTFNYLGYQMELPDGVRVSRWYPLEESYTWSFRGGWLPGESSNDPRLDATDPAGMLPFKNADLKFTSNRMTWFIPASAETAAKLEPATAEIEGNATWQQIGPTANARDWKKVPEKGSGKLQMVIQAW